MKNRILAFITIILFLFSVALFFTSCPVTGGGDGEPTDEPTTGPTSDPTGETSAPTSAPTSEPEPTGPFQSEIQFINNHTSLQYSLFLGINDDFFDIENVGGTDINDGDEFIVDIAPNGGTGSDTLELGMDEQIQKDWLVGTYIELGGVWSFLLPTPIGDGDGFTFVRDTIYVVEIHSDGNTVTISNQ